MWWLYQCARYKHHRNIGGLSFPIGIVYTDPTQTQTLINANLVLFCGLGYNHMPTIMQQLATTAYECLQTLRITQVASYKRIKTIIKTPRRPKGGGKFGGISDPQYRGVGGWVKNPMNRV